ncbi:MAG: 30S ribosomal protein S6 [Candidatus Dadabacteria bacterium]|nr:30S ribosomal protein S6 [Candidatus Dadabacteria bacterium]
MAVKPKYYETLYIIRPDIKEEELAKIEQRLRDALAAHEGEIIRFDKWAQRELAYEIQNYNRGTYYIIIFKSLPGAVAELERHLRFYNTDVLRFMTVSITEAAANKEKAAQENKAAEESSPAAEAAPAEAAPAEAAPTEAAPTEAAPAETAPAEAAPAEAAPEPAEETKTESEPATAEPTEGGAN